MIVEYDPKTFNPEVYKAFNSFAPVYTNAHRALYAELSAAEASAAVSVMVAISQHCNRMASCNELSFRRLMEVAHIGFPKVRSGLMELARRQWLKEHRYKVPGRYKVIVSWQLSPIEVLWIDQGHIVEALNLWHSALKIEPECFQVATQPESEKQNQQNQIQKPDGGTRRIPANRPNEVPIASVKAPLKSHLDEQFAAEIAKEFGTHLSQARQMIVTYGSENVRIKANQVRNDLSLGKIRKPAAVLVTELRAMAQDSGA